MTDDELKELGKKAEDIVGQVVRLIEQLEEVADELRDGLNETELGLALQFSAVSGALYEKDYTVEDTIDEVAYAKSSFENDVDGLLSSLNAMIEYRANAK